MTFFRGIFLDGSNLAVGLQNGNICMFDVLGNGDFHARSDGILQVSEKKGVLPRMEWDLFIAE